jgi:dihydrodipicolinate synthase/N-acetylneuraminate lyase
MIKIKGIITPIITPLNSDFTLDIEGFKKVIENIISGGVQAVFALGTTGEFSSLTFETKKEVIEKTCSVVNKRIITLIGISSCDLKESLALAEIALKNNADALVASPPFYFQMNQDEIFSYYSDLADKVKLPLYLYNMPGLTKIIIEPQTAKKLSEHHNIIGLKDSSGDLDYFDEIGQIFKGTAFGTYVGPEEILAESLKRGADGGVNGGSNLFPKWYVELFDAFEANDLEKVTSLQNKINELSQGVYHVSDSPNSYLQGIKSAMASQGFCSDVLAPPLLGLPKELKPLLINNLNKLI